MSAMPSMHTASHWGLAGGVRKGVGGRARECLIKRIGS